MPNLTTASDVRLGSTTVDRVYLGVQQVWPAIPQVQSYSTLVMSHSPLLYWRLNDASGTTAMDSSGNGRDGAYVNSPELGAQPLVAGEDVTSVGFDKYQEQRVALAYDAWMNTSAATVVCVYQCIHDSTALEVIAGRYWDNDDDDISWLVYCENYEFKLYYRTAGGQIVALPSGVMRDTGVTYYVAAYMGLDGVAIRIYSNGVLLSSATGTASALGSSSRSFAVASADNASANSYPMTANLQEVAYFGSVLPVSDIDILASSATTPQPKWRRRTAGVAARNGTATHTLTFPAASAGSLLVAVVAGVTGSTTVATPGWTQQDVAQDGGTELIVLTTSASGGETSLSLVHGYANIPLAFVVYEVASGSTWEASASNGNGPAPALNALPGTPVMAVAALAMESASPSNPTPDTSWRFGWHEDVDSMTIYDGTTSGIYLAVGWRQLYTETNVSPATDGFWNGPVYHLSSQINSLQSVVFAVTTP